MSALTVSSLIKYVYHDPKDIIIVDRGTLDRRYFAYKFYQEGHCSDTEYMNHLRLLGNQELFPDLCIYLKTTPEEAIRRRGGEGRIVTAEWVKNYIDLFGKFLQESSSDFESVTIFTLDTTSLSKDDVIRIIVKEILDNYFNYKINNLA